VFGSIPNPEAFRAASEQVRFYIYPMYLLHRVKKTLFGATLILLYSVVLV
jgi:hypothetical protein